jgi:hypothetical protein
MTPRTVGRGEYGNPSAWEGGPGVRVNKNSGDGIMEHHGVLFKNRNGAARYLKDARKINAQMTGAVLGLS